MERLSRKGGSRPCQSNTATAASKKEIDERRLRKLKVYLRSVTYNSCEGLPKFPTLPDLYEDTILSEEFPCDTMKITSRQHCAPTPFLIACCFNRRYPVNARKRAGNMRNKPSIKQNIVKINSLAATENNFFPTTGSTIPCGIQASNSEKVNNVVVVQNLPDATMKREKPAKTVIQDNSSGKNNGHQRPKGCCNSNHSDVEITTEKELKTGKRNSGGKTGNNCNRETYVPKAESYCGLNYREEQGMRENEDLSSEGSEVRKLRAKKMMMEETERMEKTLKNTTEHVWKTKADCLARNKERERNEKQKEETSNLENCLTNKEKQSRPANKGKNQDSSNGTSSILRKSSYHTSVIHRKPEHSTNGSQELKKNADITDEPSQTATVITRKANTLPEDEKTSVSQEPEEKRCSPRKDDITSNISAGTSRRISPRIVTSCSRHNKTVAVYQDKDRGVQRRDTRCTEKMKLKVSENANNRLRSRAVIKQPGHEKRYTKGRQMRAK